jgi:hypothetical protein
MRRSWLVLFLLPITMAAAAEKVGELPGLEKPFPMVVEESRLLVVDGFKIHVYSLEPFTLLHTFGQEGAEPGQFQYTPRVYLLPDAIVGIDFMKTAWFSYDGEFKKEKKYADFPDFDPGMEMQLIPMSSSYIRTTVDHESMKNRVTLLNAGFKPIGILYEGLFDWNKPGTGLNPVPHRIHLVGYQDKIFISDTERGFFIKVFDHRGKHLWTIDKSDKVKRIAMDPAARARIVEDIRKNQPKWIVDQLQALRFPDHFPLLHHFQVSDDHIYATTYFEEDGKREMLVLDLKGDIRSRLLLPMESRHPYRRMMRSDLYDVDRGVLYELIRRSPTSPWELHSTDLASLMRK